MEKILVPTYADDLLQFEMFCYCLNKNWQGEKNITVIVGKPYSSIVESTVEHALNKHLNSDWNVTTINGTINGISGLCEMGINKHKYADGNTLVLDAKDFLLKPSDMQDYYDGLCRINFYFPNTMHSEMYDTVPGDNNVPAVSSMTPWFWNPTILNGHMQWLETTYGKYDTWTKYPGGFEFCTWFVWAWNNPHIKKHLHTDPMNCPMTFGGVWPNQTAEGALVEERDFDKWPERKWWKYTRKVADQTCLEITCRVLKKYGIDSDYVNDWAKRRAAEAALLTVG